MLCASSLAANIHINKMEFGPLPAPLAVGDTVEWVNDDIFQHTATARNGAFDIDLKPGGKGRMILKRPDRSSSIAATTPA